MGRRAKVSTRLTDELASQIALKVSHRYLSRFCQRLRCNLFSSSGQADVVDQFIINRINVIQERSLAKFLGSLWLPFLYAFVSTVLF